LNEIGTIIEGSALSTVATRSWSANKQITLPKGKWIINARCMFVSDNTGYRAMNISSQRGDSTPQDTKQAIYDVSTSLNVTSIINVVDESHTYYLNLVHTSTASSELGITSDLNAIRIK
jgi:hypothetical protein